MSETEQPITLTTCYRHPQRETRISCGRCGRPLCPDCLRHGPVGIRCEECLRPPRVETHLAAPERTRLALGVAISLAVVWIGLLCGVGWYLHSASPNLLLSMVAGGTTGWGLWRMCGRSYNRRTAWWSAILGLLIPLVSAVILGAAFADMLIWVAPTRAMLVLMLLARGVAAAALSGLFAWLLGTQRHWERDLFQK